MDFLDFYNYLGELKKKRFLLIDDLPETVRKDFTLFISGETLTRLTSDNKPVIPQSLYTEWFNKITYQGFDFEIDLNKTFIPKVQSDL